VTPAELVRAIEEHGATVRLAGEDIKVRQASRVPRGLIEQLRDNKPAVVDALKASPVPEDDTKNVCRKTVGVRTDKKAGEIPDRRAKRASRIGLVARWSHEFGFVSVHDPLTGEWHDLPAKDAPDWSRREASRRKELRKHGGVHRLLTSVEMEDLWESEQAEMWDEPYRPAGAREGLVYDDGHRDEGLPHEE
jgi:hypothetical protein